MLRAVLLGVLSLAAVACKSNTELVKVEPGATAGKVIEVSGTVTAYVSGEVRTAGRKLAVGDIVTAGETIDTGTDGRISFELSHNLVRVDLGPNVQKRLPQTLGWNEPRRNENAKPTDQDTSAAGRPAERSAADTGATAKAREREEGAPKGGEAATAMPPSAAQAPMDHPPPPPPTIQPAPERKIAPPAKVMAPAKGNAVGAAHVSRDAPSERAPESSQASRGGNGAMLDKEDKQSGTDPVRDAKLALSGHHADLVACLADSTAVSLVLHIDVNGAASLDRKKLAASEAVIDCMQAIVKSITFAHAKVDVTMNLKK
jgi:hypothetical protein